MTALYIKRIGKAAPLSHEMEALLRKAVKLSLLRMRSDPLSEISLILTDDPGIRRLNRVFRGIDQATDVLSFAIREGEADAMEGAMPESASGQKAEQTGAGQMDIHPARLLGDIVISTERAAEQAVSYGHNCRREMAFLTVHGMLHLLGLDHETATDKAHMEKLQRQILWALGVSR
ncbi:MAG: rRNA maturation RNase YbeY [Peptococcaceae bacterium]|nr:rRNA maturation RNase YbeY [Peptococcaceae bacterium]